jgi:hypothetical protein
MFIQMGFLTTLLCQTDRPDLYNAIYMCHAMDRASSTWIGTVRPVVLNVQCSAGPKSYTRARLFRATSRAGTAWCTPIG